MKLRFYILSGKEKKKLCRTRSFSEKFKFREYIEGHAYIVFMSKALACQKYAQFVKKNLFTRIIIAQQYNNKDFTKIGRFMSSNILQIVLHLKNKYSGTRVICKYMLPVT